MSPHPNKTLCPASRARVPLPIGERGTRRNRIWDEARPNLLPETSASAPRCARLWGQTRLTLGQRTLKSLKEGLAVRQERIGAGESRCARESDTSVKTIFPQQENISRQSGFICVKICNFENCFGPSVRFMIETDAEAPPCGKMRTSKEAARRAVVSFASTVMSGLSLANGSDSPLENGTI